MKNIVKGRRKAVLLSGLLLAGGLAADSSVESRGFSYSEYLRNGAGETVAGGFTVQTPRPFFGGGGAADEVLSDAAARARALSVRDWALDWAFYDADIAARLQTRAAAEGYKIGRALGISAAERFRLSTDTVRTVEFDLQSELGGRFGHAGLNILGAFRESEDEAVAWQTRAYVGDEKGGNAGVLYRRDIGGKLAGVNAFLDYETRDGEQFWRWSAGGEFRSEWLDGFANYYNGLTDTPVTGGTSYTADGYDAELQLHAPNNPWLIGRAGYYLWEGEFGDEDNQGFRGGIRILPPGQPLQLDMEYQTGESGNRWGGRVLYAWEFGRTPSSSNYAGNFNPQDWFFAPAQREYTQRVRTGAVGGGGTSPLFRVLGINGGTVYLESSTIAITLAANSAIPNSYPATISTSTGATVILGYNFGNSVTGVVEIGSTVILQPDGITATAAPVILLSNGILSITAAAGVFEARTERGTLAISGGNAATVSYSPSGALDLILSGNERITLGGTVIANSGERISLSYSSGGVLSGDYTADGVEFISGGTTLTLSCNSASGGGLTQNCPLAADTPSNAEAVFGAANAGVLATISASGGGGGNYQFALIGTPPAGGIMVDNSATNSEAIIRYTEGFSAANNFVITVEIGKDSGGTSLTVTVNLPVNIISPPDLSAAVIPALATVTVGSDVDSILATASAAGGYGGGYVFSLETAGPLAIVADSGVISFTGTYSEITLAKFTVVVESRGLAATLTTSAAFSLTAIAPPPVSVQITPGVAVTVSATAGILATVSASGGLGNYTFSLGGDANILGKVAVGELNGETVISLSAPFLRTDAEQTYTATISAASGTAAPGSATFTLTIMPRMLAVAITPPVANAQINTTPDDIAMAAADGGVGAITYALAGLSDNVEVESGGAINLTAAFATATTLTITVAATDSAASPKTARGEFVLEIIEEPEELAAPAVTEFSVSPEGLGTVAVAIISVTGVNNVGCCTYAANGALPDGFVLESDGAVSIVPLSLSTPANSDYRNLTAAYTVGYTATSNSGRTTHNGEITVSIVFRQIPQNLLFHGRTIPNEFEFEIHSGNVSGAPGAEPVTVGVTRPGVIFSEGVAPSLFIVLHASKSRNTHPTWGSGSYEYTFSHDAFDVVTVVSPSQGAMTFTGITAVYVVVTGSLHVAATVTMEIRDTVLEQTGILVFRYAAPQFLFHARSPAGGRALHNGNGSSAGIITVPSNERVTGILHVEGSTSVRLLAIVHHSNFNSGQNPNDAPTGSGNYTYTISDDAFTFVTVVGHGISPNLTAAIIALTGVAHEDKTVTVVVRDTVLEQAGTLTFQYDAPDCPLVFSREVEFWYYIDRPLDGGRVTGNNVVNWCEFVETINSAVDMRVFAPAVNGFVQASARAASGATCGAYSFTFPGRSHPQADLSANNVQPTYGNIIALVDKTTTDQATYAKAPGQDGTGAGGNNNASDSDGNGLVFRIYRGAEGDPRLTPAFSGATAETDLFITQERFVDNREYNTTELLPVRSCTLGNNEFWLHPTTHRPIRSEAQIRDARTDPGYDYGNNVVTPQ